MDSPDEPLKILHFILAITETNGQYNEHCLPEIDRRDLSICTFFKSQLQIPSEIKVFEGDNTVRGFFRTLKAARAAKNYDVMHVHAPQGGLLFMLACLFDSKARAKSVYTVQNCYQNYRLRNRLFMLLFFGWFHRVVMCSHACLASFPWIFRWLLGDRVRVVPNPVDLERIDRVLVSHSARPKGKLRFIDVNRIIDIKNPLATLRAFHQLNDPDLELWYVGRGYLDEPLKAEIKQLGLENQVKLTGLVPRDDVYRHNADADVFVSPSRGEGLPVAVLEAMGCGLPVILSDIPPHREIAEGVDCIPMLPSEDVDGLAREMRRYRDMPAAERRRLGEACRRIADERFSLASLRLGYDEIYGEFLRKKSPAPSPALTGASHAH